MPMNMDDMERLIAEESDIRALPEWTPEQRESTRAAYQARVDALAAEMNTVFAVIEQAHRAGQPPDRGTFSTFSRLKRQHQGAQASLRRLTKAIAKLEAQPANGKRARTSPPLLAQHETMKRDDAK